MDRVREPETAAKHRARTLDKMRVDNEVELSRRLRPDASDQPEPPD